MAEVAVVMVTWLDWGEGHASSSSLGACRGLHRNTIEIAHFCSINSLQVPYLYVIIYELMVLIFTKQAETTEDLNEWRNALESALAQAPSVANTVGQNPIFSTDVAAEPAEAPAEQCKLC